MSKNPESPEIGEVFQELYECEKIAWKIPNISILQIAEDTEMRSPLFYYKKAIWVLKMCPFVWNRTVEVCIERLHSEIPEHEFLYTVYFKNHKYFSKGNNYKHLKFNFNSKKSVMFYNVFGYNWYSSFYHSSEHRCNDTITLIVKILIKKDAAVGLDFETKSPETGLGEYQL